MSEHDDPKLTSGAAGFSMLEALIGLALMVMIMAMVFSFYVNTSKLHKSERSGQDMTQAARVAIDELSRVLQQVGFGIDRPDASNHGAWQRSIVHAGAHTLAFNADMDSALGPISPSQTLTFPGGDTYTGEGYATSISGAESYVYSLDANADDTITAADRSEAETGGFNPAAGTDNPLDYALFRRSHGYDGTGYYTETRAILSHVFTNALDSTQFADGTTPMPLFTYILTEDLNRNGTLEDVECVNDVVDTCPPSATRAPLTYIWGDSNFDGELSDAERDALRTMHVGSTAWSKNRVADGGSYPSTTLTAAVDPDDTYGYVLKVGNASKMGDGMIVKIGSGVDAEYGVVTDVITSSTPQQVLLSTSAGKVHSAGDSVEVLQATLLRVIRAVEIHFTAMTPRKDQDSGQAAAGQAGRATEHGMDYRTLTLRRTIELANMETMPVRPGWVTSGKGPLPCPLTVSAVCSGNDVDSLDAMVGASSELIFKVTDDQGNGVQGAQVTFSRAGSASGAMSSGFATTNAYGEVDVNYTPTGVVGTDTVTATTSCEGTDYTDSIEVVVKRIDITVANDCRTTVGDRETNPAVAFTAEVWDVDGLVTDAPLDLWLRVDESYVSPADQYDNIQADLHLAYSLVASTDSSGVSPTHTTDTGGTGTLTGEVRLSKDTSDGGTLVQLVASTPNVACSSSGANLQIPITFYELELDSITPVSGCTESNPCTIVPYGDAPEIYGTLSLAGRLVKNVPLEFETADVYSGVAADPEPASLIDPDAVQVTDEGGRAEVAVANNSSPGITPGSPLTTTVDVKSVGEPLLCQNAAITASTSKLGFIFEGPTKIKSCSLFSDDAWGVTRDGDTRLCINAFNPNELGECGLKPTGLAITLYEENGTTVVPYGIKKIEGGAVTAAPYCGDPKTTLFEDKCHPQDRKLAQGERFDFVEYESCRLPFADVGAHQYFVLKKIEFDGKFKPGQKLQVTMFYDCTDECEAKTELSSTFELKIN